MEWFILRQKGCRGLFNNRSEAEISRVRHQTFFLSNRGSFTPNVSWMRGDLQICRHQNDPYHEWIYITTKSNRN